MGKIPAHTMNTINLYLEKGSSLGGFLQAVFSNDLFDAMARADREHVEALRDIVIFIYNKCPSDSYGSLETVRDWQANKRGS